MRKKPKIWAECVRFTRGDVPLDATTTPITKWGYDVVSAEKKLQELGYKEIGVDDFEFMFPMWAIDLRVESDSEPVSVWTRDDGESHEIIVICVRQ